MRPGRSDRFNNSQAGSLSVSLSLFAKTAKGRQDDILSRVQQTWREGGGEGGQEGGRSARTLNSFCSLMAEGAGVGVWRSGSRLGWVGINPGRYPRHPASATMIPKPTVELPWS